MINSPFRSVKQGIMVQVRFIEGDVVLFQNVSVTVEGKAITSLDIKETTKVETDFGSMEKYSQLYATVRANTMVIITRVTFWLLIICSYCKLVNIYN